MTISMILNPGAGQGDVAEVLRRFAAEREVELHETQSEGDARRAARAAVDAGRTTLIVVGGDGTLHEAVNGLAPDFAALSLLIVPGGTANDFARTLGLPDTPAEALALLERGREARIDLAAMIDDQGTRYVLNAATGGFSEQVHEQLDDQMKKTWGALAYLRAAAQAVTEPRLYHARLHVDGREMEASTYSIVVANGRFAGGGMPLAPRASPEDHRLDLLAITSADLWSQLRAASSFVFGGESETSGALIQRGNEIRVETVPEMLFSSDGEPVGRTPVVFRVLPGALRVFVPGEG
ncbi:MAG: diacylglycerol/lipid kinase family protein [Phycisphaeraceae bacterium]